MSKLLEVKSLSVCFNNDKCVVDDVSFDLSPGEILGIVGESGSGKSVTALSILQLLPRGNVRYGEKSSIDFAGQELVNTTENQMMKIRGGDISFIFQEPMSSLNPLHTIGEQIAESLRLHRGMTAKEALRETVKLLKITGIKNAKQRLKAYPFEFSGGQRQRVMIAMAIANNPRLLIADEPTTALDVTIQKQIIDLLLDLRKKMGMAIIFISHDLQLVRKIADYVCVMKDGKIVEQGEVKTVFETPKHEYTKSLICSNIALKNSDKISDNAILKAQSVTVSYIMKKSFFGRVLSELKAVDGVNLSLYQGECLGIVGESGSGKTTLGLVLADLIKYKGTVFLDNLPYNQTDKHKIRKTVQIVFQDPYNSLNPRMNIEQIVGEGLEVQFPKMAGAEKVEKIKQSLLDVGLNEDVLKKYPHEFSGGQRQRIAIARALVISPEIIIFDEPTSALDVTIQAQVLKLLDKIREKHNLSYVFISHDMKVIRAITDRVAVMNNGKIVEIGKTSDVFLHPRDEYTRRLIEASMEQGLF